LSGLRISSDFDSDNLSNRPSRPKTIPFRNFELPTARSFRYSFDEDEIRGALQEVKVSTTKNNNNNTLKLGEVHEIAEEFELHGLADSKVDGVKAAAEGSTNKSTRFEEEKLEISSPIRTDESGDEEDGMFRMPDSVTSRTKYIGFLEECSNESDSSEDEDAEADRFIKKALRF